ncbi:helix-turn-helix domain-containing protein [Flagellimonas allohymeniacidonis]|uniref:AraC family transcriptional regulator n=1 Tax=Flagellimonas allohymeniacidonis TaxID=2517819 RepID=A0A4Q8QAE8_9FLAO|nr:helix-turn-helix domain-containing protein [Allomuricauda hymeniacidonis]TAI46614.1 AraC family transcriptional regulator [Allomuricauda hymeniacidonis]
MEINYNIISIIDIFGCLQGIILGSLLLYTNRKENKSTLFLGLFVLTYAYSFIPIILEDMNLISQMPQLEVLPRPGEWLLASLFFVYIQKISIFSNRKIAYWCLYPGLLALLFQVVVFFLPLSTKMQWVNSNWYSPFFLVALIYSTGILLYMWRFIQEHSKEVVNQYTLVEHKELRWVKRFVFFGFVLFLLHFIRYFTEDSMGYRILYASYNVFMLYWASIHGILQRNIVSAIPEEKSMAPTKIQNLRSNPIDSIPISELKKLVKQIDAYVEGSKVFEDKNLTIMGLADALKLHPRKISNAINQVYHENFNAYINRYRVGRAEQMLIDKNSANLSIEGIGTEVGFNSKSAFYNAFKKETGVTPKTYKTTIPN